MALSEGVCREIARRYTLEHTFVGFLDVFNDVVVTEKFGGLTESLYACV